MKFVPGAKDDKPPVHADSHKEEPKGPRIRDYATEYNTVRSTSTPPPKGASSRPAMRLLASTAIGGAAATTSPPKAPARRVHWADEAYPQSSAGHGGEGLHARLPEPKAYWKRNLNNDFGTLTIAYAGGRNYVLKIPVEGGSRKGKPAKGSAISSGSALVVGLMLFFAFVISLGFFGPKFVELLSIFKALTNFRKCSKHISRTFFSAPKVNK